jgi:hypothetical protein
MLDAGAVPVVGRLSKALNNARRKRLRERTYPWKFCGLRIMPSA